MSIDPQPLLLLLLLGVNAMTHPSKAISADHHMVLSVYLSVSVSPSCFVCFYSLYLFVNVSVCLPSVNSADQDIFVLCPLLLGPI